MAICRNCGKDISDTAKACRFCGTRVAVEAPKAADTKTCPNCGKQVSATAKACRFCGTRFSDSDEKRVIQNAVDVSEQNNAEIQMRDHRGFVTWSILPGQIAVRVTEEDYEKYGDIKGVVIQEGCEAMMFYEGKYIDKLTSGKYFFDKLSGGNLTTASGVWADEKKRGFLGRLLDRGTERVRNWWHNLTTRNGSRPSNNTLNVSFVLIRGAEFPLIFDYKGIGTANIRCDIALHVRAKVTDFNSFYQNMLLDKQFVSYQSFTNEINPLVQNILTAALGQVSPEAIEGNADLQSRILARVKADIANVYPFVEVTKIVSFSANNQELENIRRLKEELYIAEQELMQTQARYDFINRLQATEYDQKLKEARSKTDFEALMDKIEEDQLVNKDKKEEFMMILLAEKTVREAKSQDEVETKLQEYKKNGLLREEEIDSLKRAIGQRSRLEILRNDMAYEQEKLDWEIAIGNKRQENELARRRAQDAYDDERHARARQETQEDDARQWERFQQMEALKREREDADAARAMRLRQQEIDAAMAEKRADNEAMLEKNRIYAGMTADQIMAANPDITPEAAMALAKKYEAEAALAQNDQSLKLMAEQNERLERILTEQNNRTERMAATSQEQMLGMFQAAMQGMGNLGQGISRAKDAELDRVQKDSDKNQDRFTRGVNNAVTSVAGALKTPYRRPAEEKGFPTVCPICGASLNPGDTVCPDCEAPIEG